MCELSIYAVSDSGREKVMDGVVRLVLLDGKVRLEGIFGESMEIEGRLFEVNIMAQSADIDVA
jgi:predicted RNA-binding protein